jgi:hypothetical protein
MLRNWRGAESAGMVAMLTDDPLELRTILAEKPATRTKD